ncbi:hypothetical protein EWM64_g7414 [Hericium alpestre]|uniref:Major facilitator superfamily (MFS) profile domain-containing protein n=1 Tax=Hericium alpestre TaxID=135208 RepID=A0A4Y9ZRC9_9AGAM|nr:hypothetical protein EWM64_g7414 [Hericium alpestre]
MSANTSNEQQVGTELKKGLTDRPESSRAPPTDNEFEVTLDPEDDPQKKSLLLRWLAVLTISSASVCVTCASSVASFTEAGIQQTFGISKEVAILGISLFVVGLGVGPLSIGPLSEMYGRNIVYRVSFVLFFSFSWPVAFAPNIAVYLVFRFLTGCCGATFLSVAGGSVSDMFPNNKVATPMAVYTISPFLGPEVGPLYSGKFHEYKAKHGDPPPEFSLKMGQVGGILVPIGLYWLAFTTYRHVHWIVPIIASIPFGTGTYFVFTSVFTYLVVAYRPVAASAMAGNSAMRSSFAAGFPLFASQMYARLGTVGATALLAGLTTLMAPFP